MLLFTVTLVNVLELPTERANLPSITRPVTFAGNAVVVALVKKRLARIVIVPAAVSSVSAADVALIITL
ncbi:hypothetical protein FACS1894190_10590 [Spirochaetia bacterium]|nr:hypothetical protein FACS1894190_10590 [Spirochaetia bacterium]GHV20520.1 hypothetical protein FACS189494_04450 [Spirochaetia bacterium]